MDTLLIGITDVEVIAIEGMSFGPAAMELAENAAFARIKSLVG
jgi:FMN-dependent NADH-azoreductase